MSSKATTPSKKKWTKTESAQFAEHLDERGLTIVSKEQLARLNDFVQSVTAGLNLAAPDNKGREIAVVWKDHHETLVDVAKVVLGLGSSQREYDALMQQQKSGDVLDEKHVNDVSTKVIKARSLLERMADELVKKDRAMREVTRDAAGALEIDSEGNVTFSSAEGSRLEAPSASLN